MSTPVPGEPSEQGIVGRVFEAWSAAPGYPPMRWQVSGLRAAGWCSVKSYPGGRSERPMRVSSLLTPKLYHEIEAAPMPEPSEQAAPFFDEAAVDAVLVAHRTDARQWPGQIRDHVILDLAAAVEALSPRSKAILGLARLSDEELVERGCAAVDWDPIRDGRADPREAATYAILAALGLPVAEGEATG